MSEEPRPPGLLRRELGEAVLRTRQLLEGDEDEAAEAVLAPLAVYTEAEAQIAAELTPHPPLADPEGFLAAHRRTMQALEVLERDGANHARVNGFGPFAPIAAYAVENVAAYLIGNYSDDVVDTLRILYGRREVQADPDTLQRDLLTRARQEVALVAPDYGGGGGLVKLLIGGAAVPVLGWIAQAAGAVDFTSGPLWLAGIILLALIFAVLAWLLLQGAALAHRRARLIMQPPLAALWQTIGHCGDPPEDDGRTFALLAIGLTALVWFVLPAIALLVLFLL